MKNLMITKRRMRLLILGFVLLTMPVLTFAGESQVKKYFERKDYGQIIEIITSKKNQVLSGTEDYRICGQTALMFGLYKESCYYYQRIIANSKKGFNDQDLINYAFALIKTGKSDQVLSNPCFLAGPKSSPWLKHMRNVAASNAAYLEKKDTLVNLNKLDLQFLPQYGLDYFDNNIYYSYPRFSGETEGALLENALINGRNGELAGIKCSAIGSNESAVSSEVMKKNLKGTGRIATMNVIDNNDNYFSTVVDRKGAPERIVVESKNFTAFPHNSDDYACAMPFYDQTAQRLYFCSDMPGGVGGWDIYYCEYDNNKWGRPMNIGPKVNTPFDDLFPSVFDDLLIFSSEAREGLGGFDNYAFSLTNSTLQNLWVFNTPGNDLSLRIISKSPLEAVGVNAKDANFYASESDWDIVIKPEIIKPEIAQVKNVVAEPVKVASKVAVKEASKQVAAVVPVATVKETPKEVAAVVPVATVKETPKEVAIVVPAEVVKEAPIEAVSVVPVEIVKEAPKTAPAQVINEVPKDAFKEALKEAVMEAIKEAFKEAAKDAVKETPKETPKESLKETPQETVKELNKNQLPAGAVQNVVSREINVSAEPTITDSKTGDIFLGNLYYDLNGSVFKSVHYSVLDSIAARIKEKDYANVVIWSYTDRSGAEKVNGNLSYQRALGVVEYLKSKFTDSTSKVYFTVAVGECFASTTRENNATDRRVEVYASKNGLPYNVVYAYRRMKDETPENIAKTFNNKIDELQNLNMNTPESRTNPNYVYVGIQGIHVASPGETVFRISKKYNCSIDQLLKANHKDNFNLEVAEKMIIPLPNSIM